MCSPIIPSGGRGNKELIIIINNDDIRRYPYKKMAQKYKNISVYRMPEKASLGRCMNFGVSRAKYPYIAKFDDDDFYAASYLRESIGLLRRKKVDVVGKKAHYVWLSGHQVLILRFPKKEYRYVGKLPGATLVFKKSVFERVRFPHINVGEDDRFCSVCRANGYKVYSGDRFHFAALRRKHSKTIRGLFRRSRF
ncbi:glycosyltransferase family 2 protein [Paenibacillus sp. P26]|nr:glycosyltransferase family 2 protein [Paenibacillus sp. P26]